MKKISKKTIITLTVATALVIGLNACKKDNNNSNTSATVTEADAVEMTTDAVEPATGGMTLQVSSSVTIYKVTTISCGVPKDTTITASSASGVIPTYNASLSWAYTLNCAGISPSSLDLSFQGNSTYDGVKMSLNGTTNGTFILSGLEASSGSYTLNSTYTRSGSTVSKIGNQHTYTSNVKISSSDIAVDKTTGLILSGTATVSITGTSSTGSSFSFGGTITFEGNNTANLVLNSGTKYVLQW